VTLCNRTLHGASEYSKVFFFCEFALKLRCSWESHPCHACSLCPVSVMATDIDNTEHCQYQNSLILHGKGIKFLYSKTSSVLRKKDKHTKIVPNIVFWKNIKNVLQNTQKMCKIDSTQKCLYSSISCRKKEKQQEKKVFLKKLCTKISKYRKDK
jgi:hypothetical protein